MTGVFIPTLQIATELIVKKSSVYYYIALFFIALIAAFVAYVILLRHRPKG